MNEMDYLEELHFSLDFFLGVYSGVDLYVSIFM
jgi:hypothetical protein